MKKQRCRQLHSTSYFTILILLGLFLPPSVLRAQATWKRLATPCYVFGSYHNSSVDALVSVPAYSAVGPWVDGLPQDSIVHLASFGQIGATWGITYNKYNNKLYAAAYIKRHVGLGPNGTGAIYQIDPTGAAAPSLFVDLNALFGANTAGVNPHGYTPDSTCLNSSGGFDNFSCWFNDVRAWDAVGREGLGDLDISEDGQFLYVMNMTNKTLYKIPTTNPNATNIQTFAFPIALPGATQICNSTTAVRPMGLGIKDGLVYAAAICSQEIASGGGGSNGGDYMYVYALNPATGTWAHKLEGKIARANLRYFSWRNGFTGNYDDNGKAIISDIDFDNAGGMFIGVRSVEGDKYGVQAGKPIEGNGTFASATAAGGDILKACYNAGTGKYELETDGSCGGVTTAGPASGYGLPLTNTTAKEYFYEDHLSLASPQAAGHKEVSLGGIAYDANTGEVWSTAYDMLNVYQQGIMGLSNASGARTSSMVIIENSNSTSQFGKANGLGDIELMAALCVAPTLAQVGADTATCSNGVANSNAAVFVRGITGMTKYAYRTNTTDSLWAANATASTADSIRILNIANPSVAMTYTFRLWGSDTTCYNDTTVILNPSVCPPVTFDVALTKTVNNSTATQGGNVVFTLKVNNEGTGNVTGLTVHDTLPVGMTFVSATPNGVYDPNTHLWTIGNLAAGDSSILAMTVRIDSVGVNYNTAEIHGMNETDTDSSPNNGNAIEDDIDRVCVGVPVPVCTGQGKTLTLTIPNGFTNIKWFRNGTEISGQTSSSLVVTQIGDYTFTADEATCPVEGCCPVQVIEGNCAPVCKPIVCLPVTVVRQ